MKLNWKTIFWGIVVDIALTIVVIGIAAAVAAGLMIGQGASEAQVESRMLSWTPFLASILVLGLSTTVVGGFVAASDTPSRDLALRNAGAMGVITMVLGAILHIAMPESYPLWYNILSYLAIVPCALLGGLIRARRNEKRAHRVLDGAHSPLPELPIK